jgi:kynureninase
MNYQNTLEFAKSLDEKDELKDYRSKFYIPQHQQKDCIYFTGNSLGLQPKTVSTYIQQELNDWALLGVEGHFQAKNPWMPYHENFTQQIANIVGAKESEVVVMNQLTVNLHLLMVSFINPIKIVSKLFAKPKHFHPISML